jgi:hypothetical protein
VQVNRPPRAARAVRCGPRGIVLLRSTWYNAIRLS